MRNIPPTMVTQRRHHPVPRGPTWVEKTEGLVASQALLNLLDYPYGLMVGGVGVNVVVTSVIRPWAYQSAFSTKQRCDQTAKTWLV